MLDHKRLETNALLRFSGWSVSYGGNLTARLERANPSYPPQVPPDAIFPAAWEIIDSLDGICIKNQCPELGLGAGCNAIEFDFFNYDDSVFPELQTIGANLRRKVIFLGIGYDIAGDWLVDDTGMLHFLNRSTGRLFSFSRDIYNFLERDIYGYTALNRQSIFSR